MYEDSEGAEIDEEVFPVLLALPEITTVNFRRPEEVTGIEFTFISSEPHLSLQSGSPSNAGIIIYGFKIKVTLKLCKYFKSTFCLFLRPSSGYRTDSFEFRAG